MLQMELPGLGDRGPHCPVTAYNNQQSSVAQHIRGEPFRRRQARPLTGIQPPQELSLTVVQR
ncbi:hypothetical protein GCM10010446_06850 [Streptomyces enissocaesilis]|uniref:Uncharacterized protein n=1 Tax=Streptomyces enissocaesilis TaxID=332589 RepID=A0ABP6J9G5_9ACTN